MAFDAIVVGDNRGVIPRFFAARPHSHSTLQLIKHITHDSRAGIGHRAALWFSVQLVTPKSHAPRRESNERENGTGTATERARRKAESEKSARYYARGVSRRETRRSIFRHLRRKPFPRRRLFPAGLGKSLAENFRDFIDVVSRCVMSVYRLSSGIPVRGLTHAADRPSPWASRYTEIIKGVSPSGKALLAFKLHENEYEFTTRKDRRNETYPGRPMIFRIDIIKQMCSRYRNSRKRPIARVSQGSASAPKRYFSFITAELSSRVATIRIVTCRYLSLPEEKQAGRQADVASGARVRRSHTRANLEWDAVESATKADGVIMIL